LLLAVGATAAVFLYVNGVKKDALHGGALVEVVVATQDIPANTELNPLIQQGAFVQRGIPSDVAVKDAVTSVDQLRNQTTTQPILANEQIPLSRTSAAQQITGGALGVCPTCVAVTVRVDGPPGVGGQIQRGDNVSLYATFDNVKGFTSVRALITQLTKAAAGGAPASSSSGGEFPAFTMTLEPTVKVLRVENPPPDANGATSNGSVTVTLDVPQSDAEFVTFASTEGKLYFGLLPPGHEGVQLPAQAISIDRLLGKKQP
jgi:Flp pilus assembly protein CpaB